MNWYATTRETALAECKSSAQGLTEAEASLRLEQYGPNELEEKPPTPPWLIFLRQFNDFMIWVLIAAAVISGVVGDLTDSIIIAVIVLLNALIGFVQEYRAAKAMEALRRMAALHAKALRNGHPVEVLAQDLVPGDIVLLEAGDVIPADVRLLEAADLKVNESALTGESLEVSKQTPALEEKDIPLGDQTNLGFKGTLITRGRGTGLVVATGMKTQIGDIARMLQEADGPTPLQRRMADFGRKLSFAILGVCALIFGMGLLRGEDPVEMLLIAVSLAVAAIPEALPALITIALAQGASRLVRQNTLVRHLPAVETLGSVSYICTDKTGTLTVNRMTVIEAKNHAPEAMIEGKWSAFQLAMTLNNDVSRDSEGKLLGEATELALVEYTLKAAEVESFEAIRQDYPRVAEIPFDSDRKCMTSVHALEEGFLILTKGASEALAPKMANSREATELEASASEWARDGLRVLAFAYALVDELPEPFTPENVEKDLRFCGLTGMQDPPRPGVREAILECKQAGIKPVMITGDHPDTAAAIAEEIALQTSLEGVLTGRAMAEIPEEEFPEIAEKTGVYARVSPAQKLDIVKALQSRSHFVAMTGDGVNDAPSLQRADIGVAMGITGTDVSKEASDMILLDDNFTTIVKAVKEGRRIYDNIRKFVKYMMTSNSAEILVITLAPWFGLSIPLLPIHILWINLITDGLPGLALANEQPERDIMQRPPRKSSESLFSGGMVYHILWVGGLMTAITLGIQYWAEAQMQLPHWQTMVFAVLPFAQLGHVLAIRSERTFLFRQGLFSNTPLLLVVFFTFLLQLAVIYLPFLNDLFRTQPLSLEELAICIVVSSVVFHAVEVEKFVKSILRKRRQAQA